MRKLLPVVLLLPACTNEFTFNPFDGATTTGTDGGPANSSISTSGISATAAISATQGDATTIGVDASGTTSMASTGTGTESSTGGAPGSSGGSGSSSETQGPAAPVVVAFTPAAGSDGVPSLGALSVTFDQPMSGPTMSTNVGNDSCTGSIQLSGDGFVTCVRMTSPPQTDDDLTFVVVPTAPLSSLAHYDLRVLETAQAITATPLDATVDLRGGPATTSPTRANGTARRGPTRPRSNLPPAACSPRTRLWSCASRRPQRIAVNHATTRAVGAARRQNQGARSPAKTTP